MEGRVPLLFCLVEPDPRLVADVERLVQGLNEAREWARGEVEVVNDVDTESATSPGDEAIWTLGGLLWLDEPRQGPREKKQLEEVRFLLDELRAFTLRGNDVLIEFNREEIGCISGGRLDDSLQTGLLAEWQRHV